MKNENTKSEAAPANGQHAQENISALGALRSAASFLEAWSNDPKSTLKNRLDAFRMHSEFMREAANQEAARRDGHAALLAERDRLRQALQMILIDHGSTRAQSLAESALAEGSKQL